MESLEVTKLSKALLEGKVVGIPTETVYGLGALATNETAVDKIYRIKNRPSDNPLICHFYSYEQMLKYVTWVPSYLLLLVKTFSPGPISYLLPISPNSALLPATRGGLYVVCRIPDHEKTLELLRVVNTPIAAPSANPSGLPSATSAKMVFDYFGDQVAGVLDGGRSEVGLESTILDCRNQDRVIILRPGKIGKREIEECLNHYEEKIRVEEYQVSHEVVPGNKYPHYSPTTPIVKIQSPQQITTTSNYLILASDEGVKKYNLKADAQKSIYIQSFGSLLSLDHVAQHLYENLLRVDQYGISQAYLLEEDWGESSIGKSIQNRLSKVGGSF